jgi:hypothetical protein
VFALVGMLGISIFFNICNPILSVASRLWDILYFVLKLGFSVSFVLQFCYVIRL